MKDLSLDRPGLADPKTWEYDVFISHAGEIKLTVAEEVSNDLTGLGFHCFLDKDALKPGEQADEKMETSVREAPVGLVLFDEHFFKKVWPMRELKIIFERGTLLPVLVGMTYEEFETALTAPSAVSKLGEERIKRILRTTCITSYPNESPSTMRQRIQYAVLHQFVSKVGPFLPDTRRGFFYLLLIARALKTARGLYHGTLGISKLSAGDVNQIAMWSSEVENELRKVDKAYSDRYRAFI